MPEPINPYSAATLTPDERAWMDAEWQKFLLGRQQLVDQILARGQIAQGVRQSDPNLTPGAAQIAADTLVNQQVVQGQYRTPLPSEHNELIGAAQFYGIADPEKIPLPVLRQMIGERRLGRVDRQEGELKGGVDILADVVGAAGIGTMEGLVNLADGIPFMGDALRKRGIIQDSEQFLARVSEAYRGDLPGEDVEGLRNVLEMFRGNEAAGWEVAKGLANLGTYLVGGGLVFRALAGLTGLSATGGAAAGMSRMSAMGRGALAGSGTEVVLEGGADIPFEEKVLFTVLGGLGGAGNALGRIWETIALGGGLGGAAGYAVGGDIESALKGTAAGGAAFAMASRTFSRLRRSFPTSGGEVLHGEWLPPYDSPVAGRQLRDITGFTRHGGPPPGPPPRALPPGPVVRTAGPATPTPASGPVRPAGPVSGPAGFLPSVTGTVEDVAQPSFRDLWRQTPPEIRDMVRSERRSLRRQAETDPLTEAGNRVAWERARGAIEANPNWTVVALDINNLKAANDLVSHEFGDQMIRNVATTAGRAAQEMGVPNRLFRVGGDEFIAAVPTNRADEFAERMASGYGYHQAGDFQVSIGFGMGQTLEQADAALRGAKGGRGIGEAFRPLSATHEIMLPGPDGQLVPHTLRMTQEPELDIAVFDFEGPMDPDDKIIDEMRAWKIDYELETPEGIHHIFLNLDEDSGRLIFENIMSASGDYNVSANLGPAAVRRYGRQIVQDLRNRGLTVNTIAGQRVTGARAHVAHNFFRGTQEEILARMEAGWEPPNDWWEFPADRLFGRNRQTAAADATNMTKVNQVMESPILDELAQQPGYDDYDVARALVAKNPAGVSVLQNVGDEAKIIQQILRGQVAGGIGPQDFRIVRRPVTPFIRGVAIRGETGRLIEGQETHMRAINAATAAGDPLEDIPDAYSPETYGFVTNEGQYLRPWEAAPIANQAGQLHPDAVRRRSDAEGRFYDLWSEDFATFQPEVTYRTDVLVTAGRGISNKMVKEYEEFGMFSGQHATLASGQDVVVVRPAGPDGLATVKNLYDDFEYTVSGRQIMPGLTSEPMSGLDAPGLYNAFRNYAISTLERETTTAGVRQFDWLGPETSSQLPRLMDDFFDTINLEGEVGRSALREFFDRQRVNDFRAVADPEDLAFEAAMKREAASAVAEASLRDQDLPFLESAAESKGFVLEEDPRSGFVVHDQHSGMFYAAGSEEAAEDFVRTFERSQPDYTPISDVPAELIESIPGGPNPGSNVDYIRGVREQVDDLEAQVDELESLVVAGGGGGFTPPPGVPPLPGGGEGRFLPPGEGRPTRRQQLRELYRDERERFGHLMDDLQSTVLQLMPMRNFTQQVQELMNRSGVTEDRTWEIYNRIVTGITKAHNESIPYYSGIREILAPVRRRLIRKGYMTRLLEMEPDRAWRAARGLGLNNDEIRALGQIRHFFNSVFEEAGMDGASFLFNYVPHVRNRARANHRNPFGDVDNLPKEIQFFAEYARSGNIDFRQMDIGVLMSHWVRAWQFKKHVGEAFEEMSAHWEVNVPPSRRSVPNNIAENMKTWLEVVRFGHNSRSETLVRAPARIFRKMGIPVTETEVVGMYNTAFVNAYRAGLGLRPDVWFRDSIQPLLTASRIGDFKGMGKVYTDFFRDPAERAAMWERALRHGWVEKGMVQVAEAGAFTQEMPEMLDATLSPAERQRREMFASIGDVLRDRTPQAVRGGIQGTWADPLLVYTKEGEFNRLVSGEHGWRMASKALNQYRRAPEAPDALTQLMKNSGALSWRGPVQRRFKELVRSGQDEAAAALLANEAANMQFRYGTREHSPLVQEAGMKGRLAMMFGTFTQQYAANIADGLAKDIPVPQRVGFAVRRNAVNAAVVAAAAASGWNFYKYLWPMSLTFAGGPAVGAAINAWNLATGFTAEMSGQYVDPQQQAAAEQWIRKGEEGGRIPEAVRGMAGGFFPYAGGARTVRGFGQAFGGLGTNPWEDVARFGLTGERPEQAWERGAEQTWHDWSQRIVAEQDSIYRANPLPGGGAF